MSRTIRQWVLMAAVGAAAGIMVCAMNAAPVAAEEAIRNEVRLPVDFTVLPVLMPDETEPPAPAAEPEQPAAEPEPAVPEAQPAAPEPSSPVMAGPGRVTAVTLAETPSGFTITVGADRPVTDTSYMNLADPRRLVIDLPGQWNYRSGNVVRSQGRVRHVVIGEHRDRLRLVVHYRTPPTGNVKPEFKTEGNELLITVPKQ